MTTLHTPHIIRLIGVPMDLGQSLRGVDMGPSALRYAGLADRLSRLGFTVEDYGNIETAVRGAVPGDSNLVTPIRAACETLYDAVRQAIEDGRIPLVMGGDHSIAMGTIGGVTHCGPAGVLWIDAHADFNTMESSPSGNIHGMPLAVLCGRGPKPLVDVGRPGPKIRPPDAVVIALRNVDAPERRMLRSTRLGLFTMRDIDEMGVAEVVRQALARLGHHERIHVSFDADSIDPMFAPGVGTPVQGGLNPREAHLIMELIADDGRLASAGVVEINPILDDRNRTAQLAADLLASLFGQTIL
ncbi:MAG: arginase [Bacteroidota bacterium]|nr:arginase [Bacteroidota bacterium]